MTLRSCPQGLRAKWEAGWGMGGTDTPEVQCLQGGGGIEQSPSGAPQDHTQALFLLGALREMLPHPVSWHLPLPPVQATQSHLFPHSSFLVGPSFPWFLSSVQQQEEGFCPGAAPTLPRAGSTQNSSPTPATSLLPFPPSVPGLQALVLPVSTKPWHLRTASNRVDP